MKREKEEYIGAKLPAASSLKYKTGDWKTKIPYIDEKKCIHCMKCVAYCPENALRNVNGKRTGPNPVYCKGCGVCAKVCPVGAIKMVTIDEWKRLMKRDAEKRAKNEKK